MKSQILFIFALISTFIVSCSKKEHGVFTVSGNQLLDAYGNEFIIRGVNNPHIWYPEEAYNALPLIAKYKNNTVRVVWQKHGDVGLLDKILNKCIELKMVPMVEMHDGTGDSTQVKLLEMANYFTIPEVKDVLLKYERFLLLNIANEWGDHSVTSEYWRDSYIKAVSAIRNAGYKTAIVIDAPGWGQNIEPIIKYANEVTANDTLNNILYSVHMYGSWNNEDTIKLKLEEAHDKNIPLIVGEFGYNFQDGDNNLRCKVNHLAILEKCHELGIGFLPWSFTGNSGGNEWLDLVDSNDWKSLTWWGEQVYLGKYGITKNAEIASVFRECYKQ